MHRRKPQSMPYNPDFQHRRSIRLPDYDYSQPGAYFITLVTAERETLFGKIVAEQMELNQNGQIVLNEWLRTPILRQEIILDEFVIMPNHFHAIVQIIPIDEVDNLGAREVGAHGCAPLREMQRPPRSLGSLVAGYKSAVTRQINELRGTPFCPVWQRNYYEHIIRNPDEMDRIRLYIRNNPIQWLFDKENREGKP